MSIEWDMFGKLQASRIGVVTNKKPNSNQITNHIIEIIPSGYD